MQKGIFLYKVYIGMGSNIGERDKNFLIALYYLHTYLKNMRMASIYETDPLYMQSQHKFLNTVVEGKTYLTPNILLHKLLTIEKKIGRKRKKNLKMGPRCIDLDILLYEDKIINAKILKIPHPLLHERKFALKPLIELNPMIRNPINGKFYCTYLKQLSNQGIKYYSTWECIFSKYSDKGDINWI